MKGLLPRPSYSARQDLLLGLQVCLVLGILSLLMVVAYQHNIRLDLTPEKSYTLAPQTAQILSRLRRPVRVTAFFNSQDSSSYRRMTDLLDLYSQASPHFAYRLFDLDRSPGVARQYQVSNYNSGVLESGERRLSLRSIDESNLTSAIVELIQRRPRRVVFLTGHGEGDPTALDERQGLNHLAKALEMENYRVERQETLAQPIPTDEAVVVSVGPRRDFAASELRQLESHLRSGGRLLLLLDPPTPPALRRFLARLGIEVQDDVVVDERNRFLGGDSFVTRVDIMSRELPRRALPAPPLFAEAQSVRLPRELPSGISANYIALTAGSTWSDTDRDGLRTGEPRFQRGQDHRGPLPVGVLVDIEGGGRALVYGDSDFARNLYLDVMGNKDLALNSIAILARARELIAIRRRGATSGTLSPVALTAHQARLVFWSCVVVPPVIVIVLGTVIWWKRRRS